MNPTVVSTFAGTGGSSLGYKLAGFKELLAIDFDAHAVESFKLNFPEVPCWLKSVTEVTGQEILDHCKLKWGELDVFDGSPPCQGFSTSGKRIVSDPRNDLFMHYCRLIDELGPKVFVMENVTGMAKGKFKGKFIEIMNQLKSMDYNVKCKKMNSKYYGVPQSRERLIFIGVRKDLNKDPIYPVPSTNILTVKDAISHLTVDPDDVPKITNDFIKSVIPKMRPGEAASKYHPKGSFFNNIRLPLHKPANTITRQIPVGGGFIHPLEDRMISIKECKVLCSFPEDWKLEGKLSQQWARLGNAVMPKFMEAIARCIKTDIL